MIYLGLVVVAFVIVATLNWKHGSRRNCRWRADNSGDRGTLRFYRCVACGAETFTAKSGPPQDCKQGLGKGSL